jgi:hypothetical protein
MLKSQVSSGFRRGDGNHEAPLLGDRIAQTEPLATTRVVQFLSPEEDPLRQKDALFQLHDERDTMSLCSGYVSTTDLKTRFEFSNFQRCNEFRLAHGQLTQMDI